MPNVQLKGISKYFGRIKALEKIDLEIKEGEYISILGPSGCGKTTLINCITGIVEPTHGTILIDGKNVAHIPIERRDFAMVFQSIAIFPHMTVEQNAAYGPFVRNVPKQTQEKISEEMLRLVDLLEQKQLRPRSLSGGAIQKTAVARALANQEKLLILDEPISALDYKVRVSLRYELRKLVKDLGLTAIHITHDQEEAMSISDRLVILRAGQIVEVGTPQQLYERPQTLFSMNFVGESNFIEGMIKKKLTETSYRIEFRNHQYIDLQGLEGNFHRGESIVLAFRPETMDFCSQEQDNTLSGTISRKRFSGGYIRYEVELATDDTIIIDSQTQLKEKEKTYIQIDPQDARLFTAPEFGLKKVLALE
ncbi:MAG: ABC transporter ATP-binding protein [Candidatus Heimdallarchaeota archaeon]|nr:MAG: ABC transporter ATP-binding protein [Candidatus Heimdallarchaeota archaeon]